MIDSFVLAEALTAVIGATVKIQSECSNTDGAIQLDVASLPTIALLGYDSYEAFGLKSDPVRSMISWLKRLILGDPWQTSHKTPNNESSSSSDTEDCVDDPFDVLFDADLTQTSQATPNNESASSSLRKVLFVIPDEFFDPGYDFDFTDMSDSDSDSDSDCECTRGGEPYKRPYGWMRFALKVRDKYPDGNAWLGTIGWRDHSAPGEWPVSYHGTSVEGAEGIVKTHYKVGNRNAYGRGIYSTPDIEIADWYVKEFKSQRNGKRYKVIMQNRINPEKRKITEFDNYWLVPIPEGTSAEKEKELVESSIRPYGLLIKEV